MSHPDTSDEKAIPARGLRWLLGLTSVAVALLPLSIGCNHFQFFKTREKVPEKVDVPAIPNDPTKPPSKHQIRIPPYVFLSDFEIPREQPLFKELAALRDQVMKELLIPPGTSQVEVYLFETRERYERYMKERYPNLPTRRAFFVAQPKGSSEDLLVFTFWGKSIRQDLRHELTHALLHSVIRDVPQWLDEGLAEYFELPGENKGVNYTHVDNLERAVASGSYRLNLARLERLKEVDDMTPVEYRESWAWVHLMLHSKPEARDALLSYLAQLRGSRHPGSLAPKLAKVFPDPEKILKEHLETLSRKMPSVRASDSD